MSKFIDHDQLIRVLKIENGRSLIRAVITAVVSIFLFNYVGVIVGSIWLTAMLSLEILCALSRRRTLRGNKAKAASSLILTFAMSLGWVIHAVLLWNTGSEVPQIAAVMDLFTVALYAAIGAFYSRAICLLLMLPPLAALAGLLITYLWGHATPFMAAVASTATIGTCATIVLNSVIMHRQDARLNQSRIELERLNAELARAAQAAQAANQAKSDFLSNMSHEIRTPLNGVLGMAQAMALGELSPSQAERLTIIRDSGQAVLAIVNDVLDLSKIEAGKLELESIDFALGDLLTKLQSAYAMQAQKKGLALVVCMEPGADGIYTGDPTRLRQVLSNLISNAIKFTEIGEIRIDAAYAHDALRLAVSDTGMGIEPKRLGAVFQRFSQEDSSTTRKFGGTGLGLAICSQLISLMGGSIEAMSQPGHGSAFTISLYLPRVSDAPTTAAAQPEPASVTGETTMRVLAAEDNQTNQVVLRTLLEQIGITPTIVENGAEAINAWRDGRWDLVLMDIQMPVMDGPAAAQAIREAEAKSGRARTPIIALTANAMAHQISQYRASGMDGHISKPIDARVLFETVLATAATSGEEA
ncbi:MAG TPA: ATP-binding protein [Caulobacteraceae bacterium]|nr:ATP-binding protein [Caulobacteraceae bacterium]